MNRYKKNAELIFHRLKRQHPDAHIELNYGNPMELLAATLLSAQCTDRRVNRVTARLFVKYRQPEDYLTVPKSDLESDIRSLGFFRQKAKALRGTMTMLIRDYDGTVPGTMEELTRLSGVGRKTANVILGNAFGVPGIAVDTHVIRVSNRIGLTSHMDPEKIERDLAKLYPPGDWVLLSHALIFHGRYVCQARRPLCESCRLTDLCKHYERGRKGSARKSFKVCAVDIERSGQKRAFTLASRAYSKL